MTDKPRRRPAVVAPAERRAPMTVPQALAMDAAEAAGTLPEADRRASESEPESVSVVPEVVEGDPVIEAPEPITEPGVFVNPDDPSTEFSESGFKSDVDAPITDTAPDFIASDDAEVTGVDVWREFTPDDIEALSLLPVGGTVTRTSTGWRYAMDSSGTKTETARTINLAYRYIGAMREVGDDGSVKHVTQSGETIR